MNCREQFAGVLAGVVLLVGHGSAQVPTPIEVNFGVGQTRETVQLTSEDVAIRGINISARSTGLARVCDLPNAEFAVRTFITANPSRVSAIPQLKVLRQVNVTDGGEAASFGGSIAKLLLGTAYVMRRDALYAAKPLRPRDLARLESGKNYSEPLHRNCLTAPDFRQWKAELVRVLDLYYGLAFPY